MEPSSFCAQRRGHRDKGTDLRQTPMLKTEKQGGQISLDAESDEGPQVRWSPLPPHRGTFLSKAHFEGQVLGSGTQIVPSFLAYPGGQKQVY